MRGETYAAEHMPVIVMISIHSPHARGDGSQADFKAQFDISIHSPHARGDQYVLRSASEYDISIHSPHARGDTTHSTILSIGGDFNPLPSCEGRRYSSRSSRSSRDRFQSTPLMRGETVLNGLQAELDAISIHSPHARGDGCVSDGERDIKSFQSTPLMRGETL